MAHDESCARLISQSTTMKAFGMLKVSHLYAKWEHKIAKQAAAALKKPDFFGFDESTAPSPNGTHHHPYQNGESSSTLSPSSSPRVPAFSASSNAPQRPRSQPRERGIRRFLREYSFGILSFTIVIREGMESVLFLTGVGQSEPLSLIIPGIVGIILGVLVGYFVWRGAAKLRLDWFFRISAVFLFIVAAGLASNAAAAFEAYNVARVLSALGGKIVFDTS